MGDIADMYHEMAIIQYYEESNTVNQIVENTSEHDLYLLTVDSEDELIVNIRQYYEKHERLSDKQKYCLAKWIYEVE